MLGIGRLFNVYKGEGRRSSVFALLGFLWACGALAGVVLTENLLLLQVGEDALAFSYLVTAGILICVTVALLWLVEEYSPLQMFSGVALAAALFYLYVFFHIRGHWFGNSVVACVALKAAGAVFLQLLTMSFWAFIDEFHDLQDSKRLFVLFSSAIFFGATVAGTLIQVSYFDAYQLAAVISVLMVAASVCAISIGRTQEEVYDDTTVEDKASDPVSIGLLIRTILTSRFTLFMLVTYFLMQVVNLLTDYNVLATFRRHFKPDIGWSEEAADEPLMLFVGSITAWVSFGNLIFGLFIYSRLVKRVGVNNVIPLLPAFYFLLFTGWVFFSGSLIFAVAGFAVIEGLLYIIDDNTYNLSLNAVPAKIKNKIRIVIESVFKPAGMVTSAFILSYFEPMCKEIALVLAILCVILAFAMRANYLKALYKNLQVHTISFGCSVKSWMLKLPEWQRTQESTRIQYYREHGDDLQRDLAKQVTQALEMDPPPEPLHPAVERYVTERSSDALDELLMSGIHYKPRERRQAELALMGTGEEVIGTLLHVIQAGQHPDRVRALAGRALGQIAPDELRSALPEIVTNEIARAQIYLYHSLTLTERYPHLNLHVLVDALDTGFHSVIDCIVHLVGSVVSAEQADVVALSLRSRNEKLHSQALEMLEEMCAPGLFRRLEPLLDDALPRADRIRLSGTEVVKSMDLERVLDWLLHSPALVDQIVAFTMQAQLDLPQWRDKLQAEAERNHEPVFQHFAKELLDPCPN